LFWVERPQLERWEMGEEGGGVDVSMNASRPTPHNYPLPCDGSNSCDGGRLHSDSQVRSGSLFQEMTMGSPYKGFTVQMNRGRLELVRDHKLQWEWGWEFQYDHH